MGKKRTKELLLVDEDASPYRRELDHPSIIPCPAAIHGTGRAADGRAVWNFGNDANVVAHRKTGLRRRAF